VLVLFPLHQLPGTQLVSDYRYRVWLVASFYRALDLGIGFLQSRGLSRMTVNYVSASLRFCLPRNASARLLARHGWRNFD